MNTMKTSETDRCAGLGRAPGRSAGWCFGPTARCGAALLAFALLAANAPAEGFRNPPPGTFNLGRAGGRIAQIDDSSAVQQNPANLMDVPGTEFQVTPSIVYVSVDFESVTGQSAHTKNPWKIMPNGFASTQLWDGKVALGLGATVPYGVSAEWDETTGAFVRPTGVLRYQTPYFAELDTININPTVSVKLGEHVQVGAGFDAMWSEVTLKQFYPWFIFPGSTGVEPDGVLKANGQGWAFGGNVGLTWLIADRHRLAVTYRSPLTVHYDGDFNVSEITPTAAALGATARSDFSTRIGFPTIVAAGYGVQVSDTLRLEVDGEWLQFSRFDSLDLSVGNNAFLLPTTKFPAKWKDTFTIGFGGDWRFATNWVLRAGYQFYQSPVPDATFTPTIPDADQNVITVGVGYKYKRSSFEAAYGLDFYNERVIRNDQNPAFNGDYQNKVHLFSVAYHYSF